MNKNTHEQMVLIVDDRPEIRDGLACLLGGKGYTTVGAENGRIAFEQLAAHPECQAIVCDESMPVLSGSDFLREVAAAVRAGRSHVRSVWHWSGRHINPEVATHFAGLPVRYQPSSKGTSTHLLLDFLQNTMGSQKDAE